MTTAPRILAIMGSGETAPTMAKVHRMLVARAGPPPVPAALLDTPYGFQENADELTAKAQDYFADQIGMPIELAPFRGADADPLDRATAFARLQAARYLFAGPGSPTYALAAWRGSGLAALLAGKLERGGIVVFASAASLTLGASTAPIYEIYKVGEAPRWEDGLDVLGPLGLDVAVIPHFDNAEGAGHDTRFCYLGERRLARMEAMLPEGRWVLGIDSHTALVLDLAAGTAAVHGLGGVTVRVRGRTERFAAGVVVPLGELAATAARLRSAAGAGTGATPDGDAAASRAATGAPAGGDATAAAGDGADPSAARARHTASGTLVADVATLLAAFDAACDAHDVAAAVRSVLGMDDLLVAWSRDSVGDGTLVRARETYHAMIVRLGSLVPAGAAIGVSVPDGLVDLLVERRTAARAAKEWALGDRIRDALTEVGVALHDTPAGTTWERDPAD